MSWGAPILMGTVAYDYGRQIWSNGVALAAPESGIDPLFYAKRELVPFGEYVPAPLDRVVEKFVQLDGTFEAGVAPQLISLSVGESKFKIGPLVCYEDVFPRLARESARAGAEVFFVATNNAWYGEEGGAEQHAAHSVLRAVENRRPVMRCGNGGWSGWIDAYGTVRDVLRDERGSIYYRGGGSYTVGHYEEWMQAESFYTRHGDWFIVVSGGLSLFACLVARIVTSLDRKRGLHAVRG